MGAVSKRGSLSFLIIQTRLKPVPAFHVNIIKPYSHFVII